MITRRLLPLLRSLLPDRAASMNDPTDLHGLSPGQRVQDPLLILEVDRRGGDTPHTVLTFANAIGPVAERAVLARGPAEDRRARAGRRRPGHRRGGALPRPAPAQGEFHPPAAEGRGGPFPPRPVHRRPRPVLEDPRRLARRDRAPAPGGHAGPLLPRRRLPAALRSLSRQPGRTPRVAGRAAQAHRGGGEHRPRHRTGLPGGDWTSSWRVCCCTTSASSTPTAGTGGSSR